MPKKNQSYGNESISMLKGADRVRLRPAVIFGSDGIEGCEHSVFEILSNSIDEAREGYGHEITVTRYSDWSVQVEDHGRGCPVDYNPREKRYNWELVFCEMYAGGKYHNGEDASYEYSLGLNGLGLCATQYAAEYMDVEIHTGETKYTLHFQHGENVGGLKKEPSTAPSGTKIHWKPDLQVFTDIRIPVEYYEDTLRRQAIVNNGLKFVLKNQNGKKFDTQEFLYENGIADHVKEMAGDDALTSVQSWQAERTVRDRADKPEYHVKVNVALAFSNKTHLTEYYHNSSWLEHGGAPDKAARNAFVYQIDSYLKQNNKYNKNESKITYADVEDCLILVISSFSNRTSYENQTKKAITNKGIQEAMTEMLRHQLEVYFIENPLDADKIAAQVLINKRSREDAEKTRLNLKKKLTSNMDITSRVAKFVDCRSKDVSRREIFIVEGDSALGACKQARDPDFQAIMPIRGKILNCLKADYNRIFKSDIITDLVKVLGCGVQVKSKANKDLSSFDMDNLRWNKIILCTDADVDGFQIRTLLLTMLYRLTPELIRQGKVFIAESPLYEIHCKNETYFAYDEVEKERFLKQLKGQKLTIQRSKGLGENEPDMMNLTTMNPVTRRLIKVMPSDATATGKTFDLLLGDNLSGRKQYISEHGREYVEELDVS
ncbi:MULTISPECIES: DNA gyrase/topoisomerase IV subunit B [Caproicibacterium]|jgi:DNA gyrase subunit B|uniref:DNA topoisomerase (ATP-hydrolyzing) n=1 Tax=Caproicibacterium lactatifermentans TaxID=2666138 RepID=A0A859DP13_9FIRM|nr:toprim domain-containing protein [Caproicibacterium lactatifermentans]ARP50769.1 DNA topoisomerase [Ruminococcaceae bacterium CPB6]MDD4808045.1 toprim domain-containing protein [Oscillospiraceae bacterium]QKN23500.1 DNA topoisomerase [Caproicibacterium lactatifermentans]QKO29822.1 DNA topoisomerase [Caproicibacterium lactatifermentans]